MCRRCRDGEVSGNSLSKVLRSILTVLPAKRVEGNRVDVLVEHLFKNKLVDKDDGCETERTREQLTARFMIMSPLDRILKGKTSTVYGTSSGDIAML